MVLLDLSKHQLTVEPSLLCRLHDPEFLEELRQGNWELVTDRIEQMPSLALKQVPLGADGRDVSIFEFALSKRGVSQHDLIAKLYELEPNIPLFHHIEIERHPIALETTVLGALMFHGLESLAARAIIYHFRERERLDFSLPVDLNDALSPSLFGQAVLNHQWELVSCMLSFHTVFLKSSEPIRLENGEVVPALWLLAYHQQWDSIKIALSLQDSDFDWHLVPTSDPYPSKSVLMLALEAGQKEVAAGVIGRHVETPFMVGDSPESLLVEQLLFDSEFCKELIPLIALLKLFQTHDSPPCCTERLNLKTAVKVGKVMQDFDSESLPMEAGHSKMVKIASAGSDSESKDCVNSPALTAVFRLKRTQSKILSAIQSSLSSRGPFKPFRSARRKSEVESFVQKMALDLKASHPIFNAFPASVFQQMIAALVVEERDKMIKELISGISRRGARRYWTAVRTVTQEIPETNPQLEMIVRETIESLSRTVGALPVDDIRAREIYTVLETLGSEVDRGQSIPSKNTLTTLFRQLFFKDNGPSSSTAGSKRAGTPTER